MTFIYHSRQYRTERKERVVSYYNGISLKISLIKKEASAKVIFQEKTTNASINDNNAVETIFIKPLLHRANST